MAAVTCHRAVCSCSMAIVGKRVPDRCLMVRGAMNARKRSGAAKGGESRGTEVWFGCGGPSGLAMVRQPSMRARPRRPLTCLGSTSLSVTLRTISGHRVARTPKVCQECGRCVWRALGGQSALLAPPPAHAAHVILCTGALGSSVKRKKAVAIGKCTVSQSVSGAIVHVVGLGDSHRAATGTVPFVAYLCWRCSQSSPTAPHIDSLLLRTALIVHARLLQPSSVDCSRQQS